MSAADPDRRLLHRAQRTLTVQTAAAIVLGMLVVGALAIVVVARTQRSTLDSSMRRTAAAAEDTDDPPPDMWIFEENTAGHLSGTPGAPDDLPDRADLDRVRSGGTSGIRRVIAGDEDYMVLTTRREDKLVQVVADLEPTERERHRLFLALLLAEVVGLAIAVLLALPLARRATAPLGEALSRQRRFVADASHELRTPLTQLHTRAQLLARDLRAGAAPGAVADDVDHLVSGTRQLGEMVEDLLLSSQMGRGEDGHRTAVDLGVVAAGALSEMAPRAADKGVALELVPDPDRPAVAGGREAALRRVLVALVDNAISHTAAGGSVVVTLTAGPDQVTIVVQDDGEGFDPADAERIFGRFARAGATDQRRFGLGLALAREVVTGHGGSIRAEGRPGRGATFTVRLPAHRD
ncbi:sensor histidine kinase [Actinoplanes sp. NPDC049265]|uniref:sensor histidine kinase n=1 Tax=Actinoplanes sp. NPDC049265 TaxID=3363902 RepID=UPI00370FBCB9